MIKNADHLKNIPRFLLDFLENAHNLWYTNFHFHGCFSFFLVFLPKILLKEKRPFLYPFKIYTKYYTLPTNVNLNEQIIL
uniref:Uncharacterized protein n=1 Tax=uncultured Desulfobacterium sp. TaxID=201089 RepID=E1Y9S6_9BACT|nr:unknown protein [uncultured Desulfobacterium sp.]